MAEANQPTRTIESANKAFLDGDAITDAELKLLIDFYTRVTDDLALLGPHFRLSWKECFFRLQRLEDFQRSRKEM